MRASARVLFGLAALTGTILFFSRSARAGGFTIPLIGARGSTRLAFVARPDETSAIYHNPAGLALLGEYQLDIAATGVLTHTTFRQCVEAFDINGTPGCYGGFEKPVSTTPYGRLPKGFGGLPFAGLSVRLPWIRKWTFGLAAYSPHNATGSFPDCERREDGTPTDCSGAAQRFQAIRGTVNTIYITPAASFQPHPAISIGAGISAVRASIKLYRALWLGGPDGAAGLWWDGEGLVDVDASAWSYGFNLGIIWNIGHTFDPSNRWLRGLRVGISYTSQSTFDFEGQIKVTSIPIATFAESCRVDHNTVICPARSKFTFPMNLRVGVDWEIGFGWSVAADVMWQNYSVYKEIKVRFAEPLRVVLPGRDPVVIDNTSELKNGKDVVAVMIGAEWKLPWVKGLEARLGLFFDQSPYPNSTYTLLNPDADKYGFTIGVSYWIPLGRLGGHKTELEVAVGYGALFYRDRIVRNSEIRPSICQEGDTDCLESFPDAAFSGNGDVRDKRVDVFLLQIGLRFSLPETHPSTEKERYVPKVGPPRRPAEQRPVPVPVPVPTRKTKEPAARTPAPARPAAKVDTGRPAQPEKPPTEKPPTPPSRPKPSGAGAPDQAPG